MRQKHEATRQDFIDVLRHAMGSLSYVLCSDAFFSFDRLFEKIFEIIAFIAFQENIAMKAAQQGSKAKEASFGF